MENTDYNNLITDIDSELEQDYRINVIIESLDSSDEETEVEHPPRARLERSSITSSSFYQ